ncbi:MAG: TonB-dependent receptor [Ignavibacteriales bacterium]|nr:TonB-dependent receptor [Ignavibacteriales bacterium]
MLNSPWQVLKFVLLLVLLSSGVQYAQETGNLNGYMRDSLSGEAIPFGTVYIKDIKRGNKTNSHGFFSVNGIPTGKDYIITASCLGYKTKQINFQAEKGKTLKLDIKLVPTVLEMRKIEKIGERTVEKNAPDLGTIHLNVKGMELLPKGVEFDVLRSLQTLPGVRSTGDVSAKYYVRGGASNQNLVLLDGVTLYNPYHALGMFSVIDPDMINALDFYKGGFPSEYGGRLSSVLNIVTKKGNMNNFGGKASAGLLSAKVLAEGPLPFGSFMLTGRKSLSTEILRKFYDNKNLPFDFYDLSWKVNYDNQYSVEAPRLTVFGFISADKLDNQDAKKADISWENNLIGLNWNQVFSGSFYSDVKVSYSRFSGKVIPNYSTTNPKSNTLSDFSLRYDYNYIFDSRNELRVGLDIKSIKTDFSFLTSTGLTSSYASTGTNVSLFTKLKLMESEIFGMDVGGRLNVIGLTKNGSFKFEPRLNLTYRPLVEVALKAAVGMYQQELTTLSDENELLTIFEPWVIHPEYLMASRATHYTGGATVDITDEIEFTAEIYLINMFNVPTVNYQKLYESDKDFLDGYSESYGVETGTKYSTDDITLSANYALAYAYKVITGWRYYPKYDSRHTINLTYSQELGLGWNWSLMWIYNTGLPYTKMTGFYDKLDVTDFNFNWLLYEAVAPYALLGDKNAGRLPDYHRLDFNISKKFDLSFMKLTADFSILNIYNRKNIFYFERKTGNKVYMLPVLPSISIKAEL